MANKIYVLYNSEDGIDISETTKEEFLKEIEDEELTSDDFLSKLPDSEDGYLVCDTGKYLIIEGKIITPKPKTVVTSFDLD